MYPLGRRWERSLVSRRRDWVEWIHHPTMRVGCRGCRLLDLNRMGQRRGVNS